jgi:Fur family peroxide stress response transcriptional regulator
VSDISRIEALERICREEGIPLTAQRRAVLEALIAREDHPTAEQIFAEVVQKLPDISKATVYRVLDRLVELGLIRRLVLTGMPARFDGITARHHHAACRRCGKVQDVTDERLDALLPPERLAQQFAVEDYTVVFFGLCERCRGQPPEGASGWEDGE